MQATLLPLLMAAAVWGLLLRLLRGSLQCQQQQEVLPLHQQQGWGCLCQQVQQGSCLDQVCDCRS
jgi:hypothetical protein